MFSFLKTIIILGVIGGGGFLVYNFFIKENPDKSGVAYPGICEIKESPRTYSQFDKVVVKGDVVSSSSLFSVNLYEIKAPSDTCEISVISNGASPEEGKNVKVRGEVREAYKLGSSRLLVIVEE
jgi:hypothetical protein